VTNQLFDAVSSMSRIAVSDASVEQRAEEMLGEVHRVFPFDAAILSAVDLADHKRNRPISVKGYDADFIDYLVSPEWYAECIEPFGLPGNGWPFREADLPIDPMTLRGVAEYGRPGGLNEGLLGALVTPRGRRAGFVMLSWANDKPPSDVACAVIGYGSMALASIIDPLESASRLAASLDLGTTLVALLPGGDTLDLKGTSADVKAEQWAPLRATAESLLDRQRRSPMFLWPRGGSSWYSCCAYRCRDDVVALSLRPLDGVYDLTLRELQVLTRLADGSSNGDIAAELFVTIRTVRAHVEHIFDKLSVATRSAAVSRALADGLILPEAALHRGKVL
jgi:DNA-binding CsgD family transcriptional regulator